MIGTLWNRYRYVSSIRCLIGSQIRVFDIRQANISILRDKDKISEETYQQLSVAPKISREAYIGMAISRNPEINNFIQDGIIESKKKFFEMNNIEDSEILEIDNDAIYLIGNRYIPETNKWVSGRVYFKQAEHYSSFYVLDYTRFFYFFENLHGTENVKLKGMDKSRILHEPYMLDFLKTLFCSAQTEGVQEAIKILNAFYRQYISYQLPIGFYREFNSSSRFKIRSGYHWYYIENPSPNMVRALDISYNESILRILMQYLSKQYFQHEIG